MELRNTFVVTWWPMPKWKSYEEVATYLLNRFASKFGLERVEGKQRVRGNLITKTRWEIDAKGICRDRCGFIIIECRRYLTSKQNQGKVGELAFKILDTGSQGGIIVSPLGLQKGSKEVANAMNIVHVQLDENSTNHEYVLRWLTEVMMGAQDTVGIRIEESSEIRIVSQDRASMKS